MEFHTPWAIVASGIGGVCAGIVTLATILYIVCRVPSSPDQDNVMVQSVEQQPIQMTVLEKKTGDFEAEMSMLSQPSL